MAFEASGEKQTRQAGAEMKLVFACLVIGLVLTTAVEAQYTKKEQITRGQDYFERATAVLVLWLKNISGSLDEMVAVENKKRFLERLHELNESIHEVEIEKVKFLERLANRDVPENYVLNELIKKILKLRLDVNSVTILLREEFEEGSFECERLLSESTYEKKFWIIDLAQRPSFAEDPTVIEKGNRAVRRSGRRVWNLPN